MEEFLDAIISRALELDAPEGSGYGNHQVKSIFLLLCDDAIAQKIKSNPRFIPASEYPIEFTKFPKEIGSWSYLRILTT